MTDIPAPVVLGVFYDPGSLQVIWRPETISGLSGYQVAIQDPDGSITVYTTDANTTQLTVALDITGESNYSVSVAALVNGEPGTPSAWLALLTVAPEMELITYDTSPANTLDVQWAAVTQNDVAGYVTVLAQTGGDTQSKFTTATQSSFAQELIGDYNVTVRATDSTQIVQGPPTPSYTPLLTAPTMQLITYDIEPAAQLTAQWEAVTESGVGGYVAVLAKTGASSQTSFTTDTQTSFDNQLTGTYNLTVRATDSSQIVQGPPTPSYTPLLTPPTMQLVTYDIEPAAQLTAQWEAVTESGVGGYVAVLVKTGASPQTSFTTDTQTSFDNQLTGTYNLTVRATDSSQIVQGPPTPSYTPLLTPPTMQLVTYDIEPAAQLTAQWEAVTESGVGGYVAVLLKTGTSPQTSFTTDTQTSFDNQLTGTYNLTVRATDSSQIVQGPPTPSYTPLLIPPDMQAVIYNTAPSDNLEVRWAEVNTPGVGGYIATLSQSGGNPQTQFTTELSTRFEQTVDNTYNVTVRASGANQIVLGPTSTSYAPLTVSSNVSSLAYDDGQLLMIDWEPFQGDARINGTHIDITDEPTHEAPANGPSAIPIELQGDNNTVVVRPSVGSVIVGPPGQGLTAITATPQAKTMSWNGTDFVIQWTAVSDSSVTGYNVVISENDTPQPPLACAAPPCTVPQAGLTQNTRYQTRIQASKPNVTGPFSELITGPFRATVSYDSDTQGRLTQETWTGLTTLSYSMDSAGNISAVSPETET